MHSSTDARVFHTAKRPWWKPRTVPSRVAAVTGALLILFWPILTLSLVEEQRTALIHSEKESVRSKYGRTTLGQGGLLARRLQPNA